MAIRDSSTIDGRPSTVTFQPRPFGQSGAWSGAEAGDVFDGQCPTPLDDGRVGEPLRRDGSGLDAARP